MRPFYIKQLRFLFLACILCSGFCSLTIESAKANEYATARIKQYQGPLDSGDTLQKVLRIELEVDTVGSGTPNFKGLTLVLKGAPQIAAIRLFTTDTGITFAMPRMLDSVNLPTDTVVFSGFIDTNMAKGKYYYWVTVDIVSNSFTVGTKVDAAYYSGSFLPNTPNFVNPDPWGFRFTGRDYKIGAGNQYTNLDSAAKAISDFDYDGDSLILMQITSNYDSIENAPIEFYKHSGPAYITIRPESNLSVFTFGNPGSGLPLISFDQAQKIILDGRSGGIGKDRKWSIINVDTSQGNVINYINNSSNNTLNYLNIEGETSTNHNGLIRIGTDGSTNGVGNDSIIISNSYIGDIKIGGTASLPGIGIMCKGTNGKKNSGIIIDNNHFVDIFNMSTNIPIPTASILITDESEKISIINNHMFQDTSRYPQLINSSAFIYFDNNSGGGHIIYGNYLGGSDTACTGSPYNISGNAKFSGIFFAQNNAGPPSRISGNQIANIIDSTTYNNTNYPLTGIKIAGNNSFAVGSAGNGNVIGSDDGTRSIVLVNNGGSNSLGFCGIYCDAVDSSNVESNIIGGIKVTGTSTNATTRLIHVLNGNYVNITKNVIGGTKQNNVVVSSNSDLTGIFLEMGNGDVAKNYIGGLTNRSSSSSNELIGIQNESIKTYFISNNVLLIDNGDSLNDIKISGIVDNAQGPGDQYYYHNTVKIFGTTASTANAITSGFKTNVVGFTPTLYLKNNILQNIRTGGIGGHYAVIKNFGTMSNDYNYLEVADNPNKLGQIGPMPYSFSAWQLNTGAASSLGGGSSQPIDSLGYALASFVGADNGYDLFTSNTVYDDRNDSIRDTSPWRGAYEGPSPFACNMTISVSSLINALCSGGNTGSAFAMPNSGILPYSYLWDDPSAQTTAIATGLKADTFRVIVTDSLNCIDTAYVIISEPPSIIANAGVDQTICQGDITQLTATGSSGVLPYTFSWFPDIGLNDSSIADPFCYSTITRTYSLIVTDSNSCSDTDIFVINVDTQATVSAGADDTICGEASYTLAGTFSGSADSITWTTSGTGSFDNPDSTNAIYNPSSADSDQGYAVLTITTDNPPGLCNAVSDSMVLYFYLSTATSTDSIAVACKGDTSGQAIVTPNGSGSYTYLWDDPGGQTNDTAVGLIAGQYHVTLTDPNGCISIDSVEVTEPSVALSATIDSTIDISCNGADDGSGYGSALGGITPYSYNWSNGSGDTVAYPLEAGTNTFTVTDSNGCVDSVSAIIIEPDSLLASAIITSNPSCYGACDGIATATITGGTPGYGIVWTNPDTGLVADSLCGDSIYYLTVTDANSCVGVDTFSLSQPLLLDIIITDSMNITCNGLSDGNATASASGGIDPYSYFWSNGVMDTIATSLSSGIYSVSVTDAQGCTDSVGVILSEPPLLVVLISDSTNISCNGMNDGSATASISGGTKPYTYNWNTGWTDSTIYSLQAGIYSVTITDAQGCTDSVSVNIIEPALFKITTGNDTTICSGDSIQLSSNTIGGTSPYGTSIWSPGASLTCQSCDSPFAFPAITTTYMVSVADNNNCSAQDSVKIFVNATYKISDTAVICSGDSVLLGSAYYSSAGTYYDSLQTVKGCDSILTHVLFVNQSYEQNDTTTICTGDSVLLGTIYYSAAGTYYDTLQTIAGCDSVFVLNLYVNGSYETKDSLFICLGDSVLIGDSYHNSAGVYYDSLLANLGCDSILEITLFVYELPVTNKVYSICRGDSININGTWHYNEEVINYTLQSLAGCDSLVSNEIIYSDCGFHIYNIFSPNADQMNDLWIIDGIGQYPENNVILFNRWEDEVARFQGYDNSRVVWNGTSKNGKELPSGTYFYIIDIVNEKFSGWVEITR